MAVKKGKNINKINEIFIEKYHQIDSFTCCHQNFPQNCRGIFFSLIEFFGKFYDLSRKVPSPGDKHFPNKRGNKFLNKSERMFTIVFQAV
jgi:hypothetical protein